LYRQGTAPLAKTLKLCAELGPLIEVHGRFLACLGLSALELLSSRPLFGMPLPQQQLNFPVMLQLAPMRIHLLF
jgi:hypothetical protein